MKFNTIFFFTFIFSINLVAMQDMHQQLVAAAFNKKEADFNLLFNTQGAENKERAQNFLKLMGYEPEVQEWADGATSVFDDVLGQMAIYRGEIRNPDTINTIKKALQQCNENGSHSETIERYAHVKRMDTGNTSESPLDVAVQCNNKHAVSLLLQHNPQANLLKKASSLYGFASLETAQEETLKVLFEKRADMVQQSNIFWAIRCRNLDLVRVLIEGGANVHETGDGGYTPLMSALALGNNDTNNLDMAIEIVKCDRVEVNSRDNMRRTVLHIALEKAAWYLPELHDKFISFIKILLAKDGIDLNAKDAAGNTPLHSALKQQTINVEVVQLLAADTRTDVNIPDFDGKTALYLALSNLGTTAQKENLETVATALIKNEKFDPNIKNQYGYTALHRACLNDQEKIVELLLECESIQVNILDNAGETPYDLIPSKTGQKIQERLKEKGGKSRKDLATNQPKSSGNQQKLPKKQTQVTKPLASLNSNNNSWSTIVFKSLLGCGLIAFIYLFSQNYHRLVTA